MGRFFLYLAVVSFCCFVAGLITFAIVSTHHLLGSGAIASAEFDFPGYAFGLVAVAVSFSGVYVSIVPESCIGQLKNRAAAHLIPSPFSEWKNIRDQCDPKNPARTATVKILYVLAIWGTIGRNERRDLLQSDGLDQSDYWFNKRLEWFEKQSDRLLAVTVGAVISLLYLAVPIFYPFATKEAGFSLLVVLYVTCLADVLICAVLFWVRHAFVQNFNDKAKQWQPFCENYLAQLVRAPTSAAT